ncbi:MAG: hypothetical protein PWP68_1465 [Rikenellaceae bacterium]|nr:hypothetical protein [Rikenellaceae bacterium]
MSTHSYFDEFIQIKQVREFLNLIFEYNYALVGGLAVSFWVPERKPTPGELDILIDEEEINDLLELLEKHHYTIEGWKGLEITNVAVRKEDFRFDILLAQDDWLKEELFFTFTVSDRKIKVLHPKGIIKMKLLALREKDMRDIELLENFIKHAKSHAKITYQICPKA